MAKCGGWKDKSIKYIITEVYEKLSNGYIYGEYKPTANYLFCAFFVDKERYVGAK